MIVLGAAVVPIGLVMHPLSVDMVRTLIYLGVFTQIAVLLPIRWRYGVQTLDTMPLVAAALVAPGGGVALIAWLCLFDGRRPSAEIPLWRLLTARGHRGDQLWSLPL